MRQRRFNAAEEGGVVSDLKSEFLFDFHAGLEPLFDVGQTPVGQRVIAYATGGSFEGPRLRGKTLAGGDWAHIRPDGVLVIDVRVTLETDDGFRIYVTYGGRIVMTPEMLAKAFDPAVADSLDPASYYFRTNPLFEAPVNSPYAWLNSVVAVGVGRVRSGGVSYRIYGIK